MSSAPLAKMLGPPMKIHHGNGPQALCTALFRTLLKKNIQFYWDNSLDELFCQSRKTVVDAVKEG